MSNRTDWEALAKEVLDRSSYVDDPELAKRGLRERLEAELHNAFVAGVEHESNGEVVWENECGLVYGSGWTDALVGEMGLCYPSEGREVQVAVRETGGNKLTERLRGVPVRITIRRVQGGNI